jgi:hypothetical protein
VVSSLFVCKEDRLILLKMVLEVYSYDEYAINIINIEDSQSPTDYFFFLFRMVLQQKRINRLNTQGKKKEVTLLDFMYT